MMAGFPKRISANRISHRPLQVNPPDSIRTEHALVIGRAENRRMPQARNAAALDQTPAPMAIAPLPHR